MLPPFRSAVPLTVRLVSADPEPTEPEKVVAAAEAVSPKAPFTVLVKVIEPVSEVTVSLLSSTTGPAKVSLPPA